MALEQYQTYFLNTRKVIPEMLSRFENHGVHVTWATVGILFHQNREALQAALPAQKPGYTARELSAYNYMAEKGIGRDEEEDPFHYGSSLVQKYCTRHTRSWRRTPLHTTTVMKRGRR